MLAAAPADDRVKINNERVRVLFVTDEPHRKSAMHQHDINRIMIYLDPGEILLSYEDGKQDHQHWRPGQIAWSPAGGRHTSENVGSTPIRIVEIELKRAAGPTGQAAQAEITKLDNAQVHLARHQPARTAKRDRVLVALPGGQVTWVAAGQPADASASKDWVEVELK